MKDMREEMANGKEDANFDRRDFMKSAAAAGLLGVVGMNAAAAPVAAAQAGGGGDLSAPAGVGPKGQVDDRFPVSFTTSVPQSMSILTQYFTALRERNLDGMAQLMHFPFMTYEGIDGILIESPEQLMSSPPLSMNVTGKGDSKIAPGSYDILDYINMYVYCPVGAGVAMEYTRFDPNGHKILHCHGIYGISNNNGKWGIEWVSTIFKPEDQAGRDEWYNYPIVNSAMHESHRDHVMGRIKGDLPELRKTIFDPYPHASLWFTGSNSNNANNGKPMDDYKVEGVKSRLRYSKGDTQEEISKQTYGQNNFAEVSGASVGKWALSIETPDTRAIYASANKGHFYVGYYRYTEDATVISEHRYLCALCCRNGIWYGNDTTRVVGHIMYHDRTNDLHLKS